MTANMMQKLILGSSSIYRQNLLKRLGIPFSTLSPDIDESRLDGEHAESYIERITKAKAAALVTQLEDDCILITSDQCATFAEDIIGKPHSADKAIAQLKRFSGQTVTFLTGLYLLNTRTQQERYILSRYKVTFRELSDAEIQRYVAIEAPLDCAGSFKCEGLGVALFAKMEGNDPTSLEGLPLIETSKSLRQLGLDPLA
ncbi:Maf-like protein YceF [Marinomonas aquimarina]|uniref:7-methyl-GTP pyrophosphatase n=1 Tax=Marinomonas aquimarina TaxID=295068 RepID=A0A1A8THH8_9GAMM|nr:nucleoside triphosphate pyrophosphatase [Marinomonas aquimarina]SBS31800.1 Maf-like protein YceF [Marinomonas aquimarina]